MHTHTAAWSPYSSHHLLDGTPCATSKISDEEWEAEMKRWKKWKKRNRH